MISCVAIDDDSLFLKTLKVFIQDLNTITLSGAFDNPIEGMMEVIKIKPDVLLLDMEMPYLNGLEALQTLDKHPKIIVISGHEMPPANGLKIDKFISKRDLAQSPELLEDSILSVMV